jgi:Tfp pilus assembly protein PilV
MKKLHFLLYVILLSTLTLQTSCTNDDNTLSEQQKFENEMTAALADARVYGPKTQALAQEVAEKFNGRVTALSYKTRESATRKCITDNLRPYELKDLARTTIAAGWNKTEVESVVNYLNQVATDRGIFERYKHQTSAHGYWGDLTNVRYDDRLSNEIQVKTYGMFYASYSEDVCRTVLGDEIFTKIKDKSGVEPGLSHIYYEVIRADTSSEATKARYREIAITYHALFEHINE